MNLAVIVIVLAATAAANSKSLRGETNLDSTDAFLEKLYEYEDAIVSSCK